MVQIRQKPNQKILKFSLVGLTLFFSAAFAAFCLGYRVNSTTSLPQGIWQVNALKGSLHRGQVVSVCPPDTDIFRLARSRGYIGSGFCPGGYVSLLKPIAALPGDKVTVSDQGITVNGVLLPNSKAPSTDTAGRPMNPVKPGTYTVEPGTVWLVSNYPHSFDSRYFGPVPMTNILGVAKPVLTNRNCLKEN